MLEHLGAGSAWRVFLGRDGDLSATVFHLRQEWGLREAGGDGGQAAEPRPGGTVLLRAPR